LVDQVTTTIKPFKPVHRGTPSTVCDSERKSISRLRKLEVVIRVPIKLKSLAS